MCPTVRISDDVYERLKLLAEGFDTPSNVIEKLLDEKGITLPNSKILLDAVPSGQPDLPRSAFVKIHRIEGWAKKNKQPDVGRVVQTYLDLTRGNEGVFIEDLIRTLQKRSIYDGEESKIKNNLAQMTSDIGNTHGRIFYDLVDRIKMYDAVYLEVSKYFHRSEK
jgi:hypothetical protein